MKHNVYPALLVLASVWKKIKSILAALSHSASTNYQRSCRSVSYCWRSESWVATQTRSWFCAPAVTLTLMNQMLTAVQRYIYIYILKKTDFKDFFLHKNKSRTATKCLSLYRGTVAACEIPEETLTPQTRWRTNLQHVHTHTHTHTHTLTHSNTPPQMWITERKPSTTAVSNLVWVGLFNG